MLFYVLYYNIMLRRKANEKLLEWKSKESRKSLIISGARQIGKTYIVRDFGKKNYSSFIELNFLENPQYNGIFSENLSASAIINGIRLYMPESEIIDGDTLLFLDEIQECPNAITSLKFLSQHSGIDVIATGSALGMVYNRVTSFPVGYVEYLDMYALDLREFLWSQGVDDVLIDTLNDNFINKKPVPDAIHKRMLALLTDYLVLGGMPEVINAFNRERDYRKADSVQRSIYRDYLADIARFAEPSDKLKAESCYRSIPKQLGKENHKFQYGAVEKKSTARKYESSLDWLVSANMAYSVNNVSFVEYPLLSHEIQSNFRIYPSDIGLLICTYDFSIKRALLQDIMDDPADNLIIKTAKGGIYEALVADILIKNGYSKLYFYRNEPGTIEIEFFIENEDGVIPIEVKAGRKPGKSLSNVLKKADIRYGYKLASQNVGISEKKITLPLYMAMFI